MATGVGTRYSVKLQSMIQLTHPFRRATPDDAQALAELVDFASEGLALYLWTKFAGPGGDPWAVGRERALRETGAFSFRNAVVLERDGRAAAGLIGYPLPGQAGAHTGQHAAHVRAPAGAGELGARDMVRECAGGLSGPTRARPGDGVAGGCGQAGSRGGLSGPEHHCLRRQYRRPPDLQRSGYREVAKRAKVKEAWQSLGKDWVLLVKHT